MVSIVEFVSFPLDGTIYLWASGFGVQIVKDFKFVALMFVTQGFGSQIPFLRAIFHGLGPKPKGTDPQGTKEHPPEIRGEVLSSLGLVTM